MGVGVWLKKEGRVGEWVDAHVHVPRSLILRLPSTCAHALIASDDLGTN